MSWFARSLANSFLPDPDDGCSPKPGSAASAAAQEGGSDGSGTASPRQGVKEDLSEITKTLSRQLWGVASFLAPPPQSPRRGDHDDSSPYLPQMGDSSSSSTSPSNRGVETGPSDPVVVKEEEEQTDFSGISGIRSDFAEIGGRFKSGISKLSGNKAVSEFSKIASTFLPFGADMDGEEEEERARYAVGEGVIGITEEVLTFARNISMHPETWLDFPLLPDEEDTDDFDMSDTQQEHALAIESLAPRLAALRIELCPSHMSEGCFWKIYFVLLHPRLGKEDAERLSTPQVVEARAMLLQELQSRAKPQPYNLQGSTTSFRKEQPSPSGAFHENTVLKTPILEEQISTVSSDFEAEKHPVNTTEIKIVDKSVIEEQLPNQTKGSSSGNYNVPIGKFDDDDDDDGDEWLKDEGTEMVGSVATTHIHVGDEEDVSFSDLEEEDDRITPAVPNKESRKSISENKDSKDWVQLSDSSSKMPKDGKSSPESNEWLDVEDIDLV